VALARLSLAEMQARLDRLVDMRLVERRTSSPVPDPEYHQAAMRQAPSALYAVHPSVRHGCTNELDQILAQHSHDAVSAGLLASLGEQAGLYPSAPAILDLLEEIVYHTLQAAQVAKAWDIYCHRIGGYWNLGWRLGAYERGERICRAFANGLSAPAALRNGAACLPFRQLPEDWQAGFLNEWALFLKERGSLDAAACCFSAANEPDYQQQNWTNVSTGSRNLAAVWLLSGRLTAGLQAADEALGAAERADDATERMDSYAYRGHALAQQGQTDSALTAFHHALSWQHQAAGQNHLPLYALRGVFYALLHTRLGHQAEAWRLIEANKEILLKHGGPQEPDMPKCHLVLAGLACEQGEFRLARDYWRQAHAWALERDAMEVLCWCTLVRARIELAQALVVRRSGGEQATVQHLGDHLDACRQTLADGLRIARACGFGIYHIDLLLVQAQVALNSGQSDSALAAIEMALLTGQHPLPDSGQPTLLAATDPECRYAWGEAEARHLRVEAFLLQAAQELGRSEFAPAQADRLPSHVRRSIAYAGAELLRCRALRQRLGDPQGRPTEVLRHQLESGELTRYPLASLRC
jgi:tetratricopeptide (TPR) repeat protein